MSGQLNVMLQGRKVATITNTSNDISFVAIERDFATDPNAPIQLQSVPRPDRARLSRIDSPDPNRRASLLRESAPGGAVAHVSCGARASEARARFSVAVAAGQRSAGCPRHVGRRRHTRSSARRRARNGGLRRRRSFAAALFPRRCAAQVFGAWRSGTRTHDPD